MWLGDATVHVTSHWQQRLLDNGLPTGHINQFAPAVDLVYKLTNDPNQLDEAMEEIERQRHKGRRGQRPR